jgi:hypothetical protein
MAGFCIFDDILIFIIFEKKTVLLRYEQFFWFNYPSDCLQFYC